jgi:hypothetical protein
MFLLPSLILLQLSIGQSTVGERTSERAPDHPAALSYSLALKTLPPRSLDRPDCIPVLTSDITIKSKPDRPPLMPSRYIANGDNEVVVQICIDRHGVPTSAKAVHGFFRVHSPFETYCKELRFEPYLLNGEVRSVTVYMPFRYSFID